MFKVVIKIHCDEMMMMVAVFSHLAGVSALVIEAGSPEITDDSLW